MKVVVIIDDWAERHTKIKKLLSEAHSDLTFVDYRFPAEVNLEALFKADLICLDHDMCIGGALGLSGCPHPTHNPPGTNMLDPYCGCSTGQYIVEALIQNVSYRNVWVHTSNFIQGPKMERQLVSNNFWATWTPVDGIISIEEVPLVMNALKERNHV